MGLYEILKASKLGAGAAPDMYTALFAQKIKGGGEAELSGVPPLTFRSNGTPLIDCLISGNAIPGTGDRTGNLWTLYPNQTYRGVTFEFANNTIKMNNTCTQEGNLYDSINLKAGTYTIVANANINISENTHILQIYKANVVLETISLSDMISGKATFTIAEDTTDILIRIHVMADVDYSGVEIRPMLNSGSTARSFEPYGYKIPVISGGTTTNIYLDNPLRKSLDGTVADELSSNGTITQRVDTDGSVLPTPIISQIDTPTIPTNNGSNTFDVDTTVKPSEVYIKYRT